MGYEELTQRDQVEVVRAHARRVLRAYPFTVAGLRLVAHGYNTTFRVDTADGRRFALRVNVNSRRSAGQLAAEQAWLEALARDTPLSVPVPQPTADGRRVVHEPNEVVGCDLAAVLYSWLPGRNLGDRPTQVQMRAVGAAAAVLHTHAEGWWLPPGAELTRFDQPLVDAPNRLVDDHPLIDPDAREVIDAALTEVARHQADLFRGATPIVMHQDLHGHNLRWHEGRLSVFDFDDSGLGVPVQDLAIAAYYVRDRLDLEVAIAQGYQQVRPLPAVTPAQHEALVAGRNLVLLNDLMVTSTAEWRAMLPTYLHNSVLKLRHWLETGVYRHDVPGRLTV